MQAGRQRARAGRRRLRLGEAKIHLGQLPRFVKPPGFEAAGFDAADLPEQQFADGVDALQAVGGQFNRHFKRALHRVHVADAGA